MDTSNDHAEADRKWEPMGVDTRALAAELAERAHPTRFTHDDGMTIAEHLIRLDLLRFGPDGFELAEMDFDEYAGAVCDALGIVGFDY
jgi:hypothetical protein